MVVRLWIKDTDVRTGPPEPVEDVGSAIMAVFYALVMIPGWILLVSLRLASGFGIGEILR